MPKRPAPAPCSPHTGRPTQDAILAALAWIRDQPVKTKEGTGDSRRPA